MINNFKKTENGFAQLVILGVMALSILSLSVATKFVQKNQDNRSKAAEGGSEINGVCGSANGISRYFFQISDEWLCEKGTATQPVGVGDLRLGQTSNVTWSCKGTGSGLTANCNGTQIYAENVDGVCGSINGSNLTAKPTIGLCIAGVLDEVVDQIDSNGNHSYLWHCQGWHGGNTVTCGALGEKVSVDMAGKCGTANGKTFEATPTTNLCESGNFSRIWFSVSDHRYYWRCGDVEKFGNATANCFAFVNGVSGSSKIILDHTNVSLGVGQSIKINATLEPSNSSDKITWSSNLPDFFSVDSNGLITMIKGSASGMVTAMTSSGQGAVVSVDTSIYTSKTDGVCGTANGGFFTSIPENNLCTEAVNIQGKLNGNKYTWTCFGANGGLSSTCNATINSLETNLSPTPTVISTASKPRLYFEVTRGTYPVGENVEVNVSVDSASNKISLVDIVGKYDASKLDLISMRKSDFFVFGDLGDCTTKTDEPGRILASCWLKDSINDRIASGKLITMVFKAKAVGKAEFSFDCVNKSTYDSNIIGSDSIEDIIACEQNMQMHVVVMPRDNSITPTRIPIPTKDSKIDGKCGTTKNSCNNGGFSDIADSNLYYMWKCKGTNGGITKVCSLKKAISVKIDGRCGSNNNSCISGTMASPYKTSVFYRWKCIGVNGGKTVNCLALK